MSQIDKLFGDVIKSPSYITDNPPLVIPISPRLDIALNGGVPEGSLFILTGIPKIGKTLIALYCAAKGQRVPKKDGSYRPVIYENIEGRIKKRDLEGIKGLDLSDDLMRIVTSTEGNIIYGEKYLAIMDYFVNNEPQAIGIMDSFSALAAETELLNDITDTQVAAMNRYLSKFTRRFANALPVTRFTIIGITHLMANIQKFGNAKSKVEKSGTSLQYAYDVKLWGTHKTPIMDGDTQVGHEAHWIVESSALGPPNQKVSVAIKYGRGIWEEYELTTLGKDLGLIQQKGAWLTLPSGESVQGIQRFVSYLEENPSAAQDLRAQIFDMVGVTDYEQGLLPERRHNKMDSQGHGDEE